MAWIKLSEARWINTDHIHGTLEYINDKTFEPTVAVDTGRDAALHLRGAERDALLRWLATAETAGEAAEQWTPKYAVGQRVRITKKWMSVNAVGEIGTVIEVDLSDPDEPYLVLQDSDNDYWFGEDAIEPAPAETPAVTLTNVVTLTTQQVTALKKFSAWVSDWGASEFFDFSDYLEGVPSVFVKDAVKAIAGILPAA